MTNLSEVQSRLMFQHHGQRHGFIDNQHSLTKTVTNFRQMKDKNQNNILEKPQELLLSFKGGGEGGCQVNEEGGCCERCCLQHQKSVLLAWGLNFTLTFLLTLGSEDNHRSSVWR